MKPFKTTMQQPIWFRCSCYHKASHRNLIMCTCACVVSFAREPFEYSMTLHSAEAKIAEMLYPSTSSASKLCVAMSWSSLVGVGALTSLSVVEEE